mmetsp:Transcript_28403/g.48992  ORF Transcript_28403/g.48992 Transcript_28403/m.48992 type:complete len:302 (-) Transcript_28403:300-1205(-)
MPAFCTAAGLEFKAPMFDLAEHSAPSNADEGTNDDSLTNDSKNISCLDVEKTLSPSPRLPYIGAKLFIMAWMISIMMLSIRDSTHPSFWLAYLTHWGFLVTTAYTIMSAISAVYLAMRPPANPGVLEGGVGLLVKTTWALLAIAVPAEVMITILYWVLEFDGTVEYVSVMVHGGGMVLIIIDGFLLSRLPLRMKQFIFSEMFCFFYILWSVIHAFSGIGNPYRVDDDRDEDAIYDSLAWKTNTVFAVVISVAVLLVFNPIMFLLCRAVSRLPPRRLCGEGEGQHHFKGQSPNDEEAAAVVY